MFALLSNFKADIKGVGIIFWINLKYNTSGVKTLILLFFLPFFKVGGGGGSCKIYMAQNIETSSFIRYPFVTEFTAKTT